MSESEFNSLLPSRKFDRRDFVKTAVGSGFAAAVLPVGAQTIRTDADGLTAGPVTVMSGDFAMPAYRSMPAAPSASGKFPVVVVISEVFGVHEHIADLTRRFAKLGYLSIAPELFIRQGDAKAYPDIGKLLAEVVNKVPDPQVIGDLDATVAWAAANGGDVDRLGVTGFCWGGRQTWLYTEHSRVPKAAVAWYGPLTGAPSALKPANPVDAVAKISAPVLGLYGGEDTGIPQTAVEQMRTALAGGSPAAKRSQIVVYPGAPHAFNADYRPSYNKAAADDGWKRCLDWFRANGVA